ncbi:membrane protein [Novimethylophilus kurashikiensis]|uniref:Membrane protein n=1 Tax=Novimethylophilus kurashikiensis TaxID=1825523 RepID=A0A2R5FE73_9PROT|nr:isoprenylcysteine carboxylmethyltransferase family protein [Novimethylophilus kurashikiensis]GBG14784.1 membrane protein [Novimethylophilus kurashikiensis]
MYGFLIPLLSGFILAGASAFTATWSRRWGMHGGRLVTNLLRNVLGIPLFMIGLVLAWRAEPTLQFPMGILSEVFGWFLIAAGSIPIIVGHWQLGMRTHLPSADDALMDRGLYSHVRHPIYAGAFLVFAGLAFVHPTNPWIIASVLSLVFFGAQARMEEIDLLQRMPEYQTYMERVPRFLPSRINRWTWLCPALGVVMAGVVLKLWGLSWWSAILVALMLVCPITIIWGLITLRRSANDQMRNNTITQCCRKFDEKGEPDD